MVKRTRYVQFFVIFSEGVAIVAPIKRSWTSFYLLTNVSKDAEFHGLSEYVTIFLSTYFYNSNNCEKQRKNKKKYNLMISDDIGSPNMLHIFFNEQG